MRFRDSTWSSNWGTMKALALVPVDSEKLESFLAMIEPIEKRNQTQHGKRENGTHAEHNHEGGHMIHWASFLFFWEKHDKLRKIDPGQKTPSVMVRR